MSARQLDSPTVGMSKPSDVPATAPGMRRQEHKPSESLAKLAVCVAGIYASFLTWAVLQERITTTPYGRDQKIFRAWHLVNIVQAALACVMGYLFLSYRRSWTRDPRASEPLVPSFRVARGYLLVAICQSLSSPFAYASLRYVDYLTLLLAKSCKLLPVMAVHLLLYRTRFPAYKYLVVLTITAGVICFSLFQPSSSKSQSSTELWGLFLLGINLFLDGLSNTTQDQIFSKNNNVTGPHMMCVLNFLNAVFTSVAFFFSAQPQEAVWFIRYHPQVLRDIALYGLCGAVGQIFIFITLSEFGSLVLVTTTVTRKMMSMLLSVFLFNHRLVPTQWFGVALVFAGVVGEAAWKRITK